MWRKITVKLLLSLNLEIIYKTKRRSSAVSLEGLQAVSCTNLWFVLLKWSLWMLQATVANRQFMKNEKWKATRAFTSRKVKRKSSVVEWKRRLINNKKHFLMDVEEWMKKSWCKTCSRSIIWCMKPGTHPHACGKSKTTETQHTHAHRHTPTQTLTHESTFTHSVCKY